MRYRVTFVQYREYEVDATDDSNAIAIANRHFTHDVCRPVANPVYDEVDVECIEDEEEGEE